MTVINEWRALVLWYVRVAAGDDEMPAVIHLSPNPMQVSVSRALLDDSRAFFSLAAARRRHNWDDPSSGHPGLQLHIRDEARMPPKRSHVQGLPCWKPTVDDSPDMPTVEQRQFVRIAI